MVRIKSIFLSSIALSVLSLSGCGEYAPHPKSDLEQSATKVIYHGSTTDSVQTMAPGFGNPFEMLTVEFELPKGITYADYLQKTLSQWEKKGWSRTSLDFYPPTAANIRSYKETSLSNQFNDKVVFYPYMNKKDTFAKNTVTVGKGNDTRFVETGKHDGLIMRLVLYINDPKQGQQNPPPLNEILP